MKERWLGPENRTIDLSEDRSDDFKLWLHWRHTRKIALGESGDQTFRQRQTTLNDIVHAYILGDKILDKDFKDALSDCFVEKICTTVEGKYFVLSPQYTQLLYEKTASCVSLPCAACAKLDAKLE
jgi:hypothetical protein